MSRISLVQLAGSVRKLNLNRPFFVLYVQPEGFWGLSSDGKLPFSDSQLIPNLDSYRVPKRQIPNLNLGKNVVIVYRCARKCVLKR